MTPPHECHTESVLYRVLQECPTRMSDKSESVLQECPPECPTRMSLKSVSHKNAIRQCPKRVNPRASYKSVPPECPARVRLSVIQECFARVSYKSVPRECQCLTKVSCKTVPQECPARMSHRGALQECPTRESVPQERVSHERVTYKSVRLECPTRVFHKSVPQVYPTRVTQFLCLFSSTCLHSGSWVPSCLIYMASIIYYHMCLKNSIHNIDLPKPSLTTCPALTSTSPGIRSALPRLGTGTPRPCVPRSSSRR